MINYNFRWKFTEIYDWKGRKVFFILFCKKIKNFKEHLWVIIEFNEKLKKTISYCPVENYEFLQKFTNTRNIL